MGANMFLYIAFSWHVVVDRVADSCNCVELLGCLCCGYGSGRNG